MGVKRQYGSLFNQRLNRLEIVSQYMIPHYDDEELAKLQSAIAGLRQQDSYDLSDEREAVSEGRCPAHLAPFWPLAAGGNGASGDSALFEKLSCDTLAETYSFYGFFPEIHRRLYHDGERPRITLDGRTRGPVALLHFNGGGVAIKPLQSGRERDIACLAGDAGVGPRQLPAPDGFIVEELVSGIFFTELPPDLLKDDLLYSTGKRMGEMMAALHATQIYYNDATISDPEGRSHLLIELGDSDGDSAFAGARLIDFGVSALLDRHPALEPEEVFNIARTTPEFRILSRMGIQGADLGHFLAEYGLKLAATSKEEIMARDLRFAEEGIRQAAQRMGGHIVGPFREGFGAGYG